MLMPLHRTSKRVPGAGTQSNSTREETMDFYCDDKGFCFHTARLDTWSGRRVAVIIRTADNQRAATRQDGVAIDEFSYYPVVFIQTSPPLALAEGGE
jgi:hypothetical protein